MKENQSEKIESNDSQNNISRLNSFNSIPYVKELRRLEFVKNINTCLLMAKFEMLFSENPDGFCKYSQPCAWQNKLGGLSWAEELKFTRTVLMGSFKNLVSSYRTKEEYLAAEDKFKGKYYCSYTHTWNKNKTFYFRNDELVDSCLQQLLNECSGQK